jgi:hypothetical protein
VAKKKTKRPGPAPDILKIPLGFQNALEAGMKTGSPPPDEELPKKAKRKKRQD